MARKPVYGQHKATNQARTAFNGERTYSRAARIPESPNHDGVLAGGRQLKLPGLFLHGPVSPSGGFAAGDTGLEIRHCFAAEIAVSKP